MDKIAMVKIAEVSGALAALAEAEYIKLASEEDFDAVVEAVASDLPDEYDINTVIDKTAEVMEHVYAHYDEDGQEKVAEEELPSEQDILAAYGELSLRKEAGEIDEEDFDKEAASLSEIMNAIKHTGLNQAAKNVGGKAKDAAKATGDYLGKGFKAEDLRKSLKLRGGEKAYRQNISKTPLGSKARKELRKQFKGRVGTKEQRNLSPGIRQMLASYGLAGAGAGAAGYAGKKGYEKAQG